MFRPLKIDSVQFGAKSGRHMREFGRDPSKASDREWLIDYIRQIHAQPRQMRAGSFSGQGEQTPSGHARGAVWFYANDQDVVITDLDDNFVTILKGGVGNSTSFQRAKMLSNRPFKA